MKEEKIKEVENALADFIIRICKKKEATPEELEALPKVASVLLSY